jgi:Arc/MetJ-type ribon-helix-helix transcriptional regulator
MYDRETIEQLAKDYLRAVRDLVKRGLYRRRSRALRRRLPESPHQARAPRQIVDEAEAKLNV